MGRVNHKVSKNIYFFWLVLFINDLFINVLKLKLYIIGERDTIRGVQIRAGAVYVCIYIYV